jgi:hypothetical protein
MLGDISESVKQPMSDVPPTEFSNQPAVSENSGNWFGRQAQ